MTDTLIRPLTDADAADWRRLWADYLAFYDTRLAPQVADATFRRLLDPAEPMAGLIAERDGRVVGIANILFHRHGWMLADACYLQDLFVAPDARRGGVGRALIAAVYALADARGAGSVYWLTNSHNAPARALYDSLGAATAFVKYIRPTPS